MTTYYRCSGIQSSGGGSEVKELVEGTLTSLTTDATKVKKYAFYNDTALTSFIGHNVTQLDDYAFRSTYSLATLELGNLTVVNSNALYGAGATGSYFDITLNGAAGGEAFRNSKIRKALGSISSINTGVFRECTNLIEAWWGGSNIGNQVFYGCTALADLYLLNTSGVVTLSNANALTNVPTTCKVHVPSSLLASYQADTTWSAFDLVAITE